MQTAYLFPTRTMHELWAISFLTIQLVDLVEFLETKFYKLPGRVRRLISHFGFVRFGGRLSLKTGIDFTDCIYAIVWRLLLEEVPPEFQVQNIWGLNACGNMVESLMAIAFFGPSNMANVMEHLTAEKWAHQWEMEAAKRFLEDTVRSGWQKIIADKIVFLETQILLVNHICRKVNPKNIFSRLSNKGMKGDTLDLYVAHFEAMRLGWGSALYAKPGLQHIHWRCDSGGASEWVILPHPDLTEKQMSGWMRNGNTLALSSEPAERFLATIGLYRQ